MSIPICRRRSVQVLESEPDSMYNYLLASTKMDIHPIWINKLSTMDTASIMAAYMRIRKMKNVSLDQERSITSE